MKLYAAILAFALSAAPAFAADDMVKSVTNAAKDAATQSATDKVNKKLGTTGPVTTQSLKDQAKQTATDKATSAITGAIGK